MFIYCCFAFECSRDLFPMVLSHAQQLHNPQGEDGGEMSGLAAVTQLSHHSDGTASAASASNGHNSELYVHNVNRDTGIVTIYKVGRKEM